MWQFNTSLFILLYWSGLNPHFYLSWIGSLNVPAPKEFTHIQKTHFSPLFSPVNDIIILVMEPCKADQYQTSHHLHLSQHVCVNKVTHTHTSFTSIFMRTSIDRMHSPVPHPNHPNSPPTQTQFNPQPINQVLTLKQPVWPCGNQPKRPRFWKTSWLF